MHSHAFSVSVQRCLLFSLELSFESIECFMNESKPNEALTISKFYISASDFYNLLDVSTELSFKNIFKTEWQRIDVFNSTQQRHLLMGAAKFMHNEIKLGFFISFSFELFIDSVKNDLFPVTDD